MEIPEKLEVDVLIVGCGAAGAATALHLARDPELRIAVITRATQPEHSSTYYAQGGIISKAPGDTPELLAKDIVEAGAGLSYPPAVRILSEEGPSLVEQFLVGEAEVPFSREKNGVLDFTQEAAHSCRRILHADDATGRAIEIALIRRVQATPNIVLLTGHTAVDLITLPHHSTDPMAIYDPTTCLGAYVLDNSLGVVRRILSRRTVLATGGAGQLYLHTTNPAGTRGDGIAMAQRAGATLINTEFVQFHPTTLYHRDADRFLISESVRGEGARLKNRQGEYFMPSYHPLGDLAPRDVVARAIHEEMLRNGDDYVLLDLSFVKADIARRFPTIHSTCLKFDIDITKEMIPVVPAAHYFCGGVRVDGSGRTDVRNLYGVGEVSCTGLHGANRLASTSLLEAIVWGARAARQIRDEIREDTETMALYANVPAWHDEGLMEETDPALVRQDWMTIKTTMWNYAGIARSQRRLERARADLSYLSHRVEQFYRERKLTDQLIGLRNALQVAETIVNAARRNPESRGSHFRRD